MISKSCIFHIVCLSLCMVHLCRGANNFMFQNKRSLPQKKISNSIISNIKLSNKIESGKSQFFAKKKF